MLAVIDYGVGNLYSLCCSLKKIGEEAIVTSDPDTIKNAERIILPGVGAFGDAADKLKSSGMFELLKELAEQGKPIMGICLGMQLLFEKGLEYGEHEGLGLIPGTVRSMEGYIPEGLKIPHMGWNALNITQDNPLLKNTKNGEYVYFVHSFFADCPKEYKIATAEYGAPVTAAVANKNVCGCQFHPEKSGDVGLNILRAFCGRKGEEYADFSGD